MSSYFKHSLDNVIFFLLTGIRLQLKNLQVKIILNIY